MSMEPRISIIIINYKTSSLVKNCISSIIEKSKYTNFEIIIVDNSFDKKEFALLNTLFSDSRVKIIDAQGNLGTSKANNLGAYFASGDYLFFLNSDTIFLNDAISEMAKYLDNHKDVAIVGGNLFDAEKRPTYSFQKTKYSLRNERFRNSLLSLIWRNVFKKKEFNYSKNPIEIEGYITAADLMVRKEVFRKINGFDERIFMYGEDTLFCSKVKVLTGMKMVSIPTAKIIHLEGQSDQRDYSDFKIKNCIFGISIFFEEMYGKKTAEKYLKTMERVYKRNSKLAKRFRPWMEGNFKKMSLECRRRHDEICTQ